LTLTLQPALHERLQLRRQHCAGLGAFECGARIGIALLGLQVGK
jgi:hypothetical protein